MENKLRNLVTTSWKNRMKEYQQFYHTNYKTCCTAKQIILLDPQITL